MATGMPHVSSSDAEDKLKNKLDELRLKDKERETQAHAASVGLPYFNLQGFPIPPDSIVLVPEADAKRLQLVCFWYAMNDVRLGVVDPNAAGVETYVTELGKRYFTTPQLYVISEKSFAAALETYKQIPKFRSASAGVDITEADLATYSGSISNLKELEGTFAHATATDAVTVMVAGALATRASDMHIEAEEHGVVLRYRIDGVLYPIATLPRETYEKMVNRLKLLSGVKINISDRPQDGRFAIHLTNDNIDVRVSTLPTAYGESIVMRILKASATGVEFDGLGLVGRALDILKEEMQKPNGMIISTGPTGSGKTTTLYAILKKLNTSDTKIITLEDPIEYRLEGVNQSQVDASHGYTFANGLRSILRQDPDVIMVGEIRDQETADIAANAALTGHLVLSTLHTNDAAGAIPRFMGMGLKPYLLPPALNAILGQRLVRRICASCKGPAQIDNVMYKRVQTIIASLPESERQGLPSEPSFMKGAGCAACQGIGYRGQLGIYEVLVMNKEIEKAILDNQVSETKIRDLAVAAGMITMVQDGILKALRGETTLDEVFRVTSET